VEGGVAYASSGSNVSTDKRYSIKPREHAHGDLAVESKRIVENDCEEDGLDLSISISISFSISISISISIGTRTSTSITITCLLCPHDREWYQQSL
jgi:hypothetical protein